MWDILPQLLLNGISAGMAYALVALGLTLLFGVLHIINFAHGEIYMIGGLAAVVGGLYLGLPYGLSILLAILAAAAIGFLIHWLAVEPFLDQVNGTSNVLLATYGVHLLVLYVTLSAWGPNPYRLDGLQGTLELGGTIISNQRIFVIGVGAFLVICLEYLVRRTQFGRELRAMAQDAFAARVVGVPVKSVRTCTFLLAAVLAGTAGGLLVPVTLFTPFLGQYIIIKAFVVVVIGGMGSITGALICGIALGVLEAVLSSLMNSGLALACIYSLLILVLLVRPQGLFGSASR